MSSSTRTAKPGTGGVDPEGHNIPPVMLLDGDEQPSMVLYRGHCYHHNDFGHFIVADIFTDPDGIGRADILDEGGHLHTIQRRYYWTHPCTRRLFERVKWTTWQATSRAECAMWDVPHPDDQATPHPLAA